MIELINEKLRVKIAKQGAEIKSIYHLTYQLEYMWQANSEYWARTAPVLFPIVGKLVDDTSYIDNQTYTMTQHGFARDQVFTCESATATMATFKLSANNETKKQYPFNFNLYIIYTLHDETVSVKWKVVNEETEKVLPFSIGGHPAFNLRLFDADTIDDYYLDFDQAIQLDAWLLENGTFGKTFKNLGYNDSLKLTTDLFVNDALVFKNCQWKKISLKNMKNNRTVTMDLTHFTYAGYQPSLGIWTPYKDGGVAPFICLEPWFGYADTTAGPFALQEKPGIIILDAQEQFHAGYQLIFN